MVQPELSANAVRVLEARYLRREAERRVAETHQYPQIHSEAMPPPSGKKPTGQDHQFAIPLFMCYEGLLGISAQPRLFLP
jgi:hypothetical protein